MSGEGDSECTGREVEGAGRLAPGVWAEAICGIARFAARSNGESADGAIAAATGRRCVATQGDADSTAQGDVFTERGGERPRPGDGRNVRMGNEAPGSPGERESAATAEDDAKGLASLMARDDSGGANGRAEELFGVFQLGVAALLEISNRWANF